MIKRSLRRASTQPEHNDGAGSDLSSARRTSTTPQEASRRPSLATISRKLGRSKKPQINAIVPVDSSNKLGELFTALPHDIHSLIFSLLPTADVLALRLTSSTVYNLLNDCASTITNSVLSSTLAPHNLQHVVRLYPQPIPNYDLNHLLVMLRRHHTILSTTTMLTNFIQHKIYMLQRHQRADFDQIQHRLTTINTTALWHITHVLEHHRYLLLNEHPNSHTEAEGPSSRRSRFWPCQACSNSLSATIANYPQHLLLPIYHIHHILTLHLRQSSRAPSYTGTIERALRGWSRKPPGDEQLAMVVLLGGLDELRKITVLKGTYNQRLETLKTFLIKVEDAVEERKARDTADQQQLARPRPGKMVVGPRGIERVELANSISTTASTVSSSQEGSTRPTLQTAKATPAPLQSTAYTASTADLTTTHPPKFHLLTEDTLTQIPPLEDILLLPLRRRIESELIYPEPSNPDSATAVGLLDFLPEEERDEEFETPYRWVGRVVSGEEDLYAVSFPAGRGDQRGEGEEAAADVVAGSLGQVAAGPVSGADAGPANPQQQQPQQPQLPPGINQRGRMSSMGAFSFGEFRRSILVPVGRGD